MEVIKVLVVDDSAFMRKLITESLNSDKRMNVIATARNGKDALEKIKRYAPHVITLDIEMPELSGMEVLKRVMAEKPTPVVMLSSLSEHGIKTTIDAISSGAVDFVAKPSVTEISNWSKIQDELVQKVINASKVKVQQNVPKFAGKSSQNKEISKESSIKTFSVKKKLICIGISTGGPRSLQEVISQIPKSLQVPIVIVQHMPSAFTKSLADRLDALSQVKVKEAEDNEALNKGVVYIAPGGFHTKVEEVGPSLVIKLCQSEPVNGHRPSVDVLFKSAAKLSSYHIISVIMTGMGSDGRQGLRKLKEKNKTYAIAESQETATIFGMPKAVIEAGLVDEVVPLYEMAKTILRHV